MQKFMWDIYSVWVPEKAIKEYKVDTCVYNYIKDYPPRSVFIPRENLEDVYEDKVEAALHLFWNDPQGYLRAKPYWAYWQALVDYYWRGGSLYFVTARSPSVQEATISWLLSWGLLMGPHVLNPPIRYTDKEEDRLQYIMDLRSLHCIHSEKEIFFIDDRRETCESIVSILPSNKVTVLVPERPWNVLDYASDRIHRLSDDQIAAVVSMA
jgi:hypothetical protein